MGLFNSLKDNLSSFSGEQVVRKIVEPYGELQDFKINSSAKTMLLKMMLIGEKDSIELKVNRYELLNEGGRTYIRLHDVKTSREWLTKVAQDYLLKQKFEIPEKYASMIRKFL